MLRRMGDASGVAFTTHIEPVDESLPQDGGINVYRIVQEAANNVVRHAQASSARVTIARDGDVIRVVIADDGRGFPPAVLTRASEGGFGLRSLAARTRLLGGTHRVESKPGEGTTITVEIPVAAPPQRT
jgi:signal transduction histidine kinase